jgi:exopolysaccharide biosynthesis polyprenyl glycosylphosphotransferase
MVGVSEGVVDVGGEAPEWRAPAADGVPPAPERDRSVETLDTQTLEILARRRPWRTNARSRGWLVRRALLAADVLGLSVAFVVAQVGFSTASASDRVGPGDETILFVLSLPLWVIAAHLSGLYDRDGQRTEHSTVDDLVGVFSVLTIGTWLFTSFALLTHLVEPNAPRAVFFWGMSILLVVLFRVSARSLCRRSERYLQNTIIVGAGDVGQLIARKILAHPEYGLNLVGFVDPQPRERRDDLDHLTIVGPPDKLPDLVHLLDVERVVVAFSGETHEEMLALIRALKALNVQVDVVPRLFEILGPNVSVHAVEGIPLVGLPPARLSPFSRRLKRLIDIVFAAVGLLLTAPLFLYIVFRIKRDSPGPVFFRQTRLGQHMAPFMLFKFRSMYVDTDSDVHRDHVRAIMTAQAPSGSNGIYKLDRADAVTPFGRWLRRTSLDELPQLINVLRGEMSVVGPRPCIPYETETFKPHHFERFLVPAGVTGLWQVTARARSSFGEALEMDVVYARGWSLLLDLRLLLLTPRAVLRQEATA